MSQIRSEDYPFGITLIDVDYGRPSLAASYLLLEGDCAAFIETGTSLSVPALLRVLAAKGVAREQVEYVIPTHVHLDHAGGAGALLQQLPNARLVVHPRGARHLIDPSKLIAGAAAVYGEEELKRGHGEIVPVPAARVIEAGDGFSVDLNGRRLLFLDTPGHARHHFCVVDEAGHGIFTGDTFGISYREFDTERGAFIFPTTTPVQFDPEAMHASIDRLMGYQLRYMYLTHFGRVGDLMRLAGDLHEQIDQLVAIARELAGAGAQRHALLLERLQQEMVARARAHGCELPETRMRDLLAMDMGLNAQGLEVWIDSQRSA
jgi:glyoxylase-like metal-dependent hydrolase (beta-lactamase superfamily II)